MKFNFKNDNNDGIKRVIGKNLTTHKNTSEQQKEDISIAEEPKIKSRKQNSTTDFKFISYIKSLNLIPFLLFLIFAVIVVLNRNSFIPPTANIYNSSESVQTETINETAVDNEKSENEITNDVKQEQEVKTEEQTPTTETNNIQNNSRIRPELLKVVNPKSAQKTETEIKTLVAPQLSHDEQLAIAETYKNQVANIIRQNWYPSSEPPEKGDATVIYEITVSKNGFNSKLIKSVITATIHNRSYDALYESRGQYPPYPKELGSKYLRFNVIFNRSSITTSEILLANNLSELPYTKEYQLY